MTRARYHGIAVLAVLAALFGACAKGDTVVLVRIQGTVSGSIDHLNVTAVIGIDSQHLRIARSTAPGSLIVLPAAFTLQIPRAKTGGLRVTVVASNAQGQELGRGVGEFPRLNVGSNQTMIVTLGLTPGAGADAGRDGAMDAVDVASDRVIETLPVTPDGMTGDGPSDGGVDSAVDAAIDAAQDMPNLLDVPADASPDAGVDAPVDTVPDAVPDAAPDAAPDAELDATSPDQATEAAPQDT
jgi:hypothetical protein